MNMLFPFVLQCLLLHHSHQQGLETNITTLKILLILQNGQESFSDNIPEILNNNTDNIPFDIDFAAYKIDNIDNNIFVDLCHLYEKGYDIFLDITWSDTYFNLVSSYANKLRIPHLRIDFILSSTLDIVQSYLDARNGSDVSIIFENDENIRKAFSHWIDKLSLRLTMLNGMQEETFKRINDSNIIPSFYVLIASTKNMTIMLEKMENTKLMKVPERLVLVFLDTENINNIKSTIKGNDISLITYRQQTCEKCLSDTNSQQHYFKNFLLEMLKVLENLSEDGFEIFSIPRNCSEPRTFPTKLFSQYMSNSHQNVFLMDENNVFYPQLDAIVEIKKSDGTFEVLGECNNIDGFKLEPKMKIKQNKDFFRVGTGIATPWIYRETNPETGIIQLAGYCIDFIDKLAEVMNFDYEILVTDDIYGEKQPNGSWNGLVGGLIDGTIDLVVAPMTMTAEREEAIDFATPPFATSGITIVTRKPVIQTSLFKFLGVLQKEVWYVIIAALVATALTLFALDYCSPDSSRNSQYPVTCRSFNIKECFWFALTSFTPQGGGEPPQSLSGRIIVGAYWIFVALLLATFTANLSAFLTVERMQALVHDYSLQQLIRQSKVNYTVILDSWPHAYFRNMKNTENELYALWRSLALNASTNKYRVWDYPIKEVYGNVLKAIDEFMPVANVSEGYRMVLEHTDGQYAFIHDYAEIRYAIARTCHLVEVGEPFAERPYAVAVQQGSALLEKVEKAIQTLIREGYVDFLKQKYWQANSLNQCPDDDDDDGISVDSLGGAFITTILILTPAVIFLIYEIFSIRGIFTNKIKPSETHHKNDKIFIMRESLFEKDLRRNKAALETQNRTEDRFIESQATLHPHFLSTKAFNSEKLEGNVLEGNNFTVHCRKSLRFGFNQTNERIFSIDNPGFIN